MLDPLLKQVPLAGVALLMIVACLIAAYVGVRLKRWHGASPACDPKAENPDAESYIVGSIFGLLAFFMAMTFSVSLDRFDDRRSLVQEEANALSTTYTRLALLDQPAASETRELIRLYTHTRIAPKGLWSTEQDGKLQASRQARSLLWDRIRVALMPWRETDFASNILEPLNEAFEIGTKRELIGRTHIPTRIFEVLFLYTLVSAGVLGFVVGDSGRGRQLAAALLLWLYTISFVLILDIDRPQAGSVRVPQLAMEELAASMDREAAATQAASRR